MNIPLDPGTGEIGWIAGARARPAGARRRVPPGGHRLPARRRFPRVRPARPPQVTTTAMGRAGQARRLAGPPARRRPVARHRRRRLRRLPRRATDVGPGLARADARGGARRPAERLARPLGGRRRQLRPVTDPDDARRSGRTPGLPYGLRRSTPIGEPRESPRPPSSSCCPGSGSRSAAEPTRPTSVQPTSAVPTSAQHPRWRSRPSYARDTHRIRGPRRRGAIARTFEHPCETVRRE